MLDATLRPMKDRVLVRPARMVPAAVSADAVTVAGLLLTLVAAYAAARTAFVVAFVLWGLGRVLDGFDGVVARLRSTDDDVGGYLDLLADTVGYAVIPLGIAIGIDSRVGWIGVAVLLGAFYLNTVSWTLLSTIIDRRSASDTGPRDTKPSRPTAFTMPPALVEGTETMVFYALFLMAPASAPILFFVMAAAVGVNVIQRLSFARTLR